MEVQEVIFADHPGMTDHLRTIQNNAMTITINNVKSNHVFVRPSLI